MWNVRLTQTHTHTQVRHIWLGIYAFHFEITILTSKTWETQAGGGWGEVSSCTYKPSEPLKEQPFNILNCLTLVPMKSSNNLHAQVLIGNLLKQSFGQTHLCIAPRQEDSARRASAGHQDGGLIYWFTKRYTKITFNNSKSKHQSAIKNGNFIESTSLTSKNLGVFFCTKRPRLQGTLKQQNLGTPQKYTNIKLTTQCLNPWSLIHPRKHSAASKFPGGSIKKTTSLWFWWNPSLYNGDANAHIEFNIIYMQLRVTNILGVVSSSGLAWKSWPAL